ncbi:glycosyltransferase family 2 protein [Leptolyngbya iicbica]|uniref:Glycosyltransferase family 2 protein n=2 Tax=Cyanophyceae TaxID=3028117 RepID=A0A4Q7E9J7_9CYAN|nr:glycosyltransferase family 2 protein [Leptolyngbya sp. LK]RZM79292.1 glycosyltransferase family 2 protein [Leptolyngbya sp. LK]
MSNPNVSIIIVNYNGGDVVIDCLTSIFQNLDTASIEVIVVDNDSRDRSPDFIEQQFPTVKLLRQAKNLGFGAANNIGAHHAQGTHLFLLNSDTLIQQNILPTLVNKLESSPRLGIVGPRLLNPDGSFQLSTAYAIGLWGEWRTLQAVRKYRQPALRAALAQQYQADRDVDILVGAAMLMRRSHFFEIGGFDENFFMYFEESDLCQRFRNAGYHLLYTPDVALIHIGGFSVAQVAGKMAAEYRRSQRYYYKKHRPQWEQWVLHCYLAFKQWQQRQRT